MDGYIRIGTKIDDSGFEKDYKNLIKKYSDMPSIEGEAGSEEIIEQKRLVDELAESEEKRIAFKEKILQLAEINTNLLFQDKEFIEYITDKLGEQGINAESLLSSEEGRLAIVQAIAEEYGVEIQKLGEMPKKVDDINNNLKKHSDSIEGIFRKIKRWTFSLLGVSTAYGAIKKIINTLVGDNEQFKTDLEYIGWSLKQALLTVLESIGITAEKVTNAIKKLLMYIAYIIKMWTGKNIFENASIDKYNKSLKKTSSGLKEIRKQLAGFDEANVLNSNTGGVNGLGVPSFDLSNWADELNKLKPPSWLEWLGENKKFIEDLALTALGIFGAGTIASWIKNIGGFLGSSELGALGTQLGLLGVIAGGIVITYICAKQVWDDLEKLQGELLKIADNGQLGQKKWLEETEPTIKQVHDTWRVNVASTNNMYFGTESILWDVLSVVDLIMGRDDTRLELAKKQSKLAKQQIDYLIKEYNKGELTKEQREDIVDIIQNQIKENNIVIEQLRKQGKDTSEIEGYNKDLAGQLYAVKRGIEYNKDETEKWWIETGKVKTNFDGTVELIDEINNTDLKDKTVDIKADKTLYDSTIDSIEQSKNTVDVEVNANTQKLKTGIVGAIGGALGSITIKPLGTTGIVGGLGALAGKTLKNLFKFAKGGIINQPGRGVPIGYNAIAGEAGREGIIPLTDAQQMEILGQSIGRYIRIDNVIDVNMDSRRINRILKESEEKANFSANR